MNADILNVLGFSDEEISECLEKRGLLSIELEFTRKCNLRCIYCYSSAGEPASNELNIGELQSVLRQAKDLGARKIILLGGGEPLLFNGLKDIIEYISSLGLKQILFTNGTLLDADNSGFLFKNKVSVIVKHNSTSSAIQDTLAGVPGTSRNIKRGLAYLMEAGYPDGDTALGIQTVICRQNIDDLPSMWTWARQNGVIPYFEILTRQGRAKIHAELNVTTSKLRSLFELLKEIDKEDFSIKWDSRPTIAAFSCRRHLYSCLVNSEGYVQPCTGVDIPTGNIREKPLKDIINESTVMNNLRNIHKKIVGRCSDCEHSGECYGCRGNAYHITGDYLASDPTCWHCEGKGSD